MCRSVLKQACIVCLGSCLGLTLAADAAAQSRAEAGHAAPVPLDLSGWNRIGDLRDGQKIVVSLLSGFPMHCTFRGITDRSLFCEQRGLLLGFDTSEIGRDDIARVRTDDYPRDRGIVMAVLGGAGLVEGAAAPTTPDTGAMRAGQALLLGAIGAGVGYAVSLPIAVFAPGKTIYRRPLAPSPAHLPHPLFKRPATDAQTLQP